MNERFTQKYGGAARATFGPEKYTGALFDMVVALGQKNVFRKVARTMCKYWAIVNWGDSRLPFRGTKEQRALGGMIYIAGVHLNVAVPEPIRLEMVRIAGESFRRVCPDNRENLK